MDRPFILRGSSMKSRQSFLKILTIAFFSTANIANAVVGQNDIDAARFITLPFDEVFDNTGLPPSSEQDASGEDWPEDICVSGGAGYMHYKYKPTEDQMINIVASGDDTEIRVINSENDTCLHTQDSDNLNYFAGDGNPESGIFVPDTDEGGNYIPASVDEPGYVGEAPHWYQETYFSDYGTCGHGCSEDTVDEVSLTANTTYIIQIAANYAGRQIQGGPCANEELPDGSCLIDNRSPTFVSIAVGGVGAATDRPTAATAATPVPTLPLFGFGILASLLGLFGLRKLRQ